MRGRPRNQTLRDVEHGGETRPGAPGPVFAAWSPEAGPGPKWGHLEMAGLRASLAARRQPWDVVVVGAGITGAGIARDAALRGLSTLVLDSQDLAFGTSSRSSRLIHGGVRYLEQGELGLVFEALRERNRLYAAAPHLVRPSRFLFPSYEGDRLGPWRLRMGLTLYDLLNFHRGDPHEFFPPESTRAEEPLLRATGLLGAVQYEDAVTDDARLTLAVLQDARRHGASVLTYAKVTSIAAREGLHTLAIADGPTIVAHQAVVAAGPWTGQALLGTRADDLLRLSKGIHIVMRAADVPVRQPLVVQAPRQRRILFVVPWGSRTYLGTTDAPYQGDPGRSSVSEADEAELLAIIGDLLPSARLDAQRIVSAWSGVRPLVREQGAGADTAEVSRRHRVIESDEGVIGIVGGKLTTYRAMAEDAVDRVVQRIARRSPVSARPCTTAARPLTRATPITADELRNPVLADLATRHGNDARAVFERCRRDTRGHDRIVPDLPYRWCEIDHAIAFEGVTRVSDVLRRRVPLALTDAELGASAAPEVARRLVAARDGSEADVRDELERYVEDVRRETRRVPRVRR